MQFFIFPCFRKKYILTKYLWQIMDQTWSSQKSNGMTIFDTVKTQKPLFWPNGLAKKLLNSYFWQNFQSSIILLGMKLEFNIELGIQISIWDSVTKKWRWKKISNNFVSLLFLTNFCSTDCKTCSWNQAYQKCIFVRNHIFFPIESKHIPVNFSTKEKKIHIYQLYEGHPNKAQKFLPYNLNISQCSYVDRVYYCSSQHTTRI